MTKVRDRVLHVMLLDEIKVQRAKISDDTQIDMLLKTFPEAFNYFKVNYNMNKMKFTMTELMKELCSTEEIIIKTYTINTDEVKSKKNNNVSNINNK